MIEIETDFESQVEAVLFVAGEIDLETSDQLREVLMDAVDREFQKVTIDLDQVSFIDSSGIATLVEALQAINGYGGKLLLTNLQENVRSVFDIANLLEVFTIEDDH